MSEANPAKGTWTHRFLVRVFGVAFGVLVFWLLGFVVNDIGTWPGPSLGGLETERLEMFHIGASDPDGFVTAVNEMTDRAREMGPNKCKGS